MNNGGLMTHKELNEIIERAMLPTCPLSLLNPSEIRVIDDYVYVLPVDPAKPVKIVFEGDPISEEEIMDALYEKLKEFCNENKESN